MNVYEITSKALFYLLAEDEIAAEKLGEEMTLNASVTMPGNVTLDCSASLARSQSDEIKARALNKET